MSDPIEIFYSYSHKDEELREELNTHLKLLERQHLIKGWHDRCITAGTEWAGKIDEHLESAQVILLLISNYFMASDYCWDVELKRAMERHEAGEARVIPIILRPVDMKGAPFSKLQALPKDAKPVTKWGDRDEAFVNITQGIRKVVESLAGPVKPAASKPAAVAGAVPAASSGAANPGPGAATAASAPKAHPALEMWKKKLVSLETAIVTVIDPGMKFAVEQQIEEAKAKIKEYGG